MSSSGSCAMLRGCGFFTDHTVDVLWRTRWRTDFIKRTDHTVEERVFARKCRRAGVTAACGGQRERLKRLH
eukprot:1202574-Prymnesium_polylepis.1